MSKPATPTSRPTDLPFAATLTETNLPSVATRRLLALLDAYPTLSMPIATAMVERAAQEPTGSVLVQLEHALDQFDTLPDLTQLSGSQVRVLDVALREVSARIAQLQAQLHLAWENN